MADEIEGEVISQENREAADLVDDRAEPIEESRAEPVKEEAPAEPEKKEPRVGSKFGDKRSDISKKYREARDRADEDHAVEGLEDDRERMLYGRDVETRADREARRREERGETVEETAGPEERAEEAPASRMKLNVRGKELDLPQDEVIALAQKAAAADEILDHAKQIRAEQQRILDELQTARGNQTPAEKQASEAAQDDEPAKQPDDSELDDIIDRIQVGSPEDAKKALEKYGDNIVTRVMERIGNVDEHIEQTIRVREENTERQREMMQTLDSFAEKNPEFAESPALQSALATEAALTMRENMRAIGVRDDTFESLKEQHGFSDQQATAYAYRYLRGKGYELPDNGSVLTNSAEKLRKTFGISRQAEQQQNEPRDQSERVERKRNLGPQPRRANASPNAEVKERSIEESRKQAVRQMRMARRGRA